jgi:hypothetical protein
LSIAAEFGCALQRLRAVALFAEGRAVEWFDCEALDRRHALGRGSLLVFDYLPPGGVGEPWHQRKALLAQAFREHDWRQVPEPEALYGVPGHDPASLAPQEFYRQLRQWNARWGCRFYEGLVAKRITDAYPLQRRSPDAVFVGWVKHRWAG